MQLVWNGLNSTITDEQTFSNGEHIFCQIHFCAFLQRAGRTYLGLEIKTLVQRLIDNKCGVCGSAPVSGVYSDVGYGMLTVNYVDDLP